MIRHYSLACQRQIGDVEKSGISGILFIMMVFDDYSNWVEVDLSAIESNVRLITKEKEQKVMAVVKANAYGHGSLKVAKTALKAGAEWLAVARAEEAMELRESGIKQPVLVLGFVPLNWVKLLILSGVSMVAWDIKQIENIAAIAEDINVAAKIHIKVDTGMSRIGVQEADVVKLVRTLKDRSSLIFEGVLTHYACADNYNKDKTIDQINIFEDVLLELAENDSLPNIIHASNSAATLFGYKPAWDMVRLGIAMYGLDPSDRCSFAKELEPALSWKSYLIQVKEVPAGTGVSYGHDYVTKDTQIVGTVSAGYADGYRRHSNNEVLVGGKRVPVVGRVCMDYFMVNLDSVSNASVGDEVVMLGRQGSERITAEELAITWNTINYEVLCGISARVIRKYV